MSTIESADNANEEIRRIDRNASNEIKVILEEEGVNFNCRATSQDKKAWLQSRLQRVIALALQQ